MKNKLKIEYVSEETSKNMFGEASKKEGYAVYNGQKRVSFIYDEIGGAQSDLQKLNDNR